MAANEVYEHLQRGEKYIVDAVFCTVGSNDVHMQKWEDDQDGAGVGTGRRDSNG